MSSEIQYTKASERTACVLVLDASASMDETSASGRSRIEELNAGIQILKQELMADVTARSRVELAIVCIGGPAGGADLLMDWTDVPGFMPPALSAGGMTPLGAGMHIALDQVAQRKQYYKSKGYSYTRPWIFVISDGEPTDDPADWSRACQASLDANVSKRAAVFSIGVDRNANLHVLSQLCPPDRPALGMDSTKFSEFFLWLSASLGEASRSGSGHQVQLPPVTGWTAVD